VHSSRAFFPLTLKSREIASRMDNGAEGRAPPPPPTAGIGGAGGGVVVAGPFMAPGAGGDRGRRGRGWRRVDATAATTGLSGRSGRLLTGPERGYLSTGLAVTDGLAFGTSSDRGISVIGVTGGLLAYFHARPTRPA